MQLVLVTWTDAYRSQGDFSEEEAQNHGTVIVEDVGWLVADHEDHIVMAQGRLQDGEESIRDPLAIPKGIIISVVPLAVPDPDDVMNAGSPPDNIRGPFITQRIEVDGTSPEPW